MKLLRVVNLKFLSGRLNRPWVLVLIISLVTIGVYLNTLGNEFVWDDKGFIRWPMIRSYENIKFFLKGALPDEHFGDYRPLKGIILTINYALFKDRPLGYHLTAIFIHLTTTLMVYLVTSAIFRNNARVRLLAFAAALLFGVHPIHTEAITFVTSSSDVIGITFFLAAFYFYVRNTQINWGNKAYFLASLFFAALAFLSYEMTLVLPFILFLYDVCFGRLIKVEWIGRIKNYLVYLGVIILYAIWRYGVLGISEGKSYPENNFFLNIITMVKVFAQYVVLTVFPKNLTVAHEISPGVYAMAQGDFNRTAYLAQKITDGQFIISFLVLLIIVLAGIWSFRKYPLVTFCIFWFFLALLPVANIFPLGTMMAERYLYLASFGFCLLAGWLLVSLSGKNLFLKWVSFGFYIFLIVYFSVLTINRNTEWRDSFTLWLTTVGQTPKSAVANFNLAVAYEDRGDTENSLKYFEIANENNGNKLARFPLFLGEANARRNDLANAHRLYGQALEYADSDFERYYSQARLYQIESKESLAIEAYKRAILANSTFLNSYINLGVMYGKQKKWEKAAREFKIAQALDPSLVHTYINLAYVYEQTNQQGLALAELESAAIIDPENKTIKTALERLKNSSLLK